MSDEAFAVTVIALALIIIGMWVFLFVYIHKKRQQPLDTMKSNRHLLYALFAKHKSGLSAPNGATMKVGYGEKGFVIIGNGL